MMDFVFHSVGGASLDWVLPWGAIAWVAGLVCLGFLTPWTLFTPWGVLDWSEYPRRFVLCILSVIAIVLVNVGLTLWADVVTA